MTHALGIVEGDSHFRYLLRRYAENYGFEVYCSENEDEILAFMRSKTPRVMFIDADMPGRRLQEFINILTTKEEFTKTAIVSSSWDDRQVQRQPEGVAASVSKALLYEGFVKLIEELGIYPNSFLEEKSME